MIRFGIVGTGSIAARFARALARVQGVEATGISSRSRERGEAFARENGVKRVYAGEEAMLADGAIDVVYVAVPHAAHYECCLRALQAGKHVLCEKPMCISAQEAQALFEEAQRRGLFLMEGMWSRFLPNSMLARRWIDEGRIGRVKLIDGVFSFAVDENAPKPRLVRPELAGGAMFDLGVYTIEMASYYAGCEPERWAVFCEPYCEGTDGTSVMALRYPNGVLATLRMGITCEAQPVMTIWGETGHIELPRFFSGACAVRYEGERLAERCEQDCELPGGFVWEIEAVRDALLSGCTRSAVVPPETTIATAKIMREMMHSFFPERY